MRNPENKLAMQETTMERPRGLIPLRLQSPDAENRTSGGVGALAGATSRQGDPIFQSEEALTDTPLAWVVVRRLKARATFANDNMRFSAILLTSWIRLPVTIRSSQ